MRIRDEQKPGGYRHFGFEPLQAWPDDCWGQWGDCGVVFSRTKENYVTAFFEAFPENPSTFIRGEGKTIADAELDAFKQYQKLSECDNHEFERRGYKNGAGFCKHCGLFMSKVFEPTEKCTHCDKPTYYTSDNKGNWWCEEHHHLIPEEDLSEIAKWLRDEETSGS